MTQNHLTSWPRTHIHWCLQIYVSLLSAPPSQLPLFLLSPGGSWLVLLYPGPAQQVEEEADEEVVVVVEEGEGEEEGGLGEEG